MPSRTCLALAAMLLTTTTPARADLDLSPDGRQLVFRWTTEGAHGLALINTDGTGFRALPDSASGRMPQWSPDGNYIVFESDLTAGSRTQLYDVTSQKTRTVAGDVVGPYAWREDSQWFIGYIAPEEGPSALVSYSLSENGITQRIPLPFDGRSVRKTIWLPQTNDAALLVSTPRGQNVYLVEAAEVKKITTSDDVLSLELTEGGKTLLWARRSPNLKYILLSLYAYDLTSRSVKRLPFPQRVPALNPDPRHAPESVDHVALSPDGARLALIATFAEAPTGARQPPKRYRVCYSIRTDGTDARLVRRVPYAPPGGQALIPAWSRDGRMLAVLDVKAGTPSALALYNADGSGGRRLLPNP